MRSRRRPNCGCQIVHPVKENVVHCCSEETVQHVHPSHTTVVNHHLIKNEHVYPHSTSFENTVNEIDVFGGAFNTPETPGPGNQVGGAMNPNMGQGSPPQGTMPNQVGGAMSPEMGPGKPPHGHVMNHNHGQKPHKWC